MIHCAAATAAEHAISEMVHCCASFDPNLVGQTPVGTRPSCGLHHHMFSSNFWAE